MQAVAAFLVLFMGFVVAVVGASSMSSRSVVAPDVTRGVFLTVESPELSEDELLLLSELERVDNFPALLGAITPATSLLVIDRSAMAGLPPTFLRDWYMEGGALLGINLFGNELAAPAGLTDRQWPTPEQWAQSHDGHGEGAMYSYIYRTAPAAEIERSGGGQHHFKDNLLPAVLSQLLSGQWRE